MGIGVILVKVSRKGLENTWFISDTHFFHKNIIKHCSRPFASVEEMHEVFISNWNYVVGRKDEVFHLGDFSFNSVSLTNSEEILSRLNGIKIFIRGNHDNSKLTQSTYWDSVHDSLALKIEEHLVILCHYPYASWNHQNHGSFHLHGHVHSKRSTLKNYQTRRYDVGVDRNNFAPISFQTCLEIMNELETFQEQNSISSWF